MLPLYLIRKFQNGFFFIYVVHNSEDMALFPLFRAFCSSIFLIVFYFPFAVIT